VSRGQFITLEGGEGAGKSTLLRGLRVALEARGLKVIGTREPGGTPAADEIRDLLVRGERDRWSALSEALLFTAARNDHLDRVVRPALRDGAWVLCDRYADSTWAYQVAGGGLPEETFVTLHKLISANRPDLTIVLDVDPQAGVGRSRGGETGEARFEAMDMAFHTRVREAFLSIAAREPDRCVVIDSGVAKEDVLHAALNAIDRRLLK
jgi:dTMP kinase